MKSILIPILSSLITAAIIISVLFIRAKIRSLKITNIEALAEKNLNAAKREANDIQLKAQKEAQQITSNARIAIEEELASRRQSVAQIENRVIQKEKYLENKETSLNDKEASLEREFDKVKHLKKKQDSIIQDLLQTLEKAAGFSKEEAKKMLMSNVEREIKQRAGLLIKQVETQARKIANRKAREIVVDAIQRTAVDHIVPATTSVVQLPDDEMKGRIIGREGRNIRAFESITGVDVIIDDTPNAVVLSAFDPIRRATATLALEKLISDGRIHPARVEETIELAKKELKDIILEHGERAADEVGFQFHPKIIELLGKLHFRTSYGQNVLAHSLETAHVAALIAQELQVNVTLAKRGAILHDIGKAIDFEQSGTHTELGKEICERYGESDEILNCIMAHHEEVPAETVEAVIVKVSDSISSARPGARRESLETYIKRLEKLETIASSFEGVEKAYAIQAGREVRVLVKPDVVDDPGAHKLALDIAKEVETRVDYPGEVKVSIIRETRAISVAR